MANQRLTQTQLVRLLAEATESNNKTVRAILEQLATTAITEVKKNGVFVLPASAAGPCRSQGARGRNPATGESIKIPAKKVVKFRVAKAAKDAIVPRRKRSSLSAATGRKNQKPRRQPAGGVFVFCGS